MIPPQITSPRWDGRTKLVVGLVTFALVLLLLLRVRDTFPLIIVTTLIAYLLTPLVNFNERRLLRFLRGGRRSFGVLLAFIFAVLAVVLVLVIILPVIATQLRNFGDALPEQLGSVETRLTEVLSQPVNLGGQPLIVEGQPFVPMEYLQRATGEATLGEMLRLDEIDFSGAVGSIAGTLGGLTRPAFSFVGGAFTTFVNITFFLVMLFYLLKDGRLFVDTVVRLSPPAYQGDARRLFYETGQIWNAYFRGQLILSTWVGVFVFIATSLIGLPNALVLGVISALLEFVPNIGPFIAMIPAAFLALVSTSTTIAGLSGVGFALVTIALYFTIQNVQAILVTPRVMGDNLNLHPFVVIIAVIFGASIAGALGVILAAPFMATARLIFEYLYAKLMDREPFTEIVVPTPQSLPDTPPPLLPDGTLPPDDTT